MRRTQAGISLLEMLVSLLMTLVISGALFTVFVNTFQSREVVVGQGTAETNARTPIDVMADHLRNAQQYWTTGGTTPTLASQSSVLADASTTSVTYYASNNVSDTVQYWLDGTILKRTAGASTTVVMTGVQSLELTYYKTDANANYNNSGVALTAGNGHSPTSGERSFISQIQIRAKVNVDGYSREIASLVRLRNSPYKVHL
jgi:type II secretory pathway component PulJ